MDLEFRNELREENDRNWDRMRSELDAMSARLTAEFRSGLAELRSDLNPILPARSGIAEEVELCKAAIRAVYREQRRWMFLFWATAMLALVAADIL